MSIWRVIDAETDTRATEITGVGVLVANVMGMCFVPGARILSGRLQRENRSTPPMVAGRTAAEIRAKQALVVDPGAAAYITRDVNDTEY